MEIFWRCHKLISVPGCHLYTNSTDPEMIKQVVRWISHEVTDVEFCCKHCGRMVVSLYPITENHIN